MVCRNICEMFGCKPSFEYDQYILGTKYCRRCGMYITIKACFVHAMECRRLTPTSKKGKERIRRQRKKAIAIYRI